MGKRKTKITNPNWGMAVSLSLALFGLAYLLKKSIILPATSVDFQFVWLAGVMWRDWLNPYSETFLLLGEQNFVGMMHPHLWFYPPNWWPIATTFSLAPFETSLILWRGLSALLIVAGCLTLANSFHRNIAQIRLERLTGFFAFTCLMSATPIAMFLGQTSFLIFFGATCFVAAYLGKNRPLMVLAICLLMLKPQIGLPFTVFLLASRYWWPSILVAALITIVMCIPALMTSGVAEFVEQYFSQFGPHQELEPNHPFAMTGLRHLLFYIFGWNVSLSELALTSTVLAFALGKISLKKYSPEQVPLVLLTLVLLICLVVPLHTYDMMLLSTLIILSATQGAVFQIALTFCLAIIFRANNLAALLGIHDAEISLFIGSRLTSFGILLLFCIATVKLLALRFGK